MKLKIGLDIDMQTGVYDLHIDNLSRPGSSIDVVTLREVVGRVMDSMVTRHLAETEQTAPTPRRLVLN